MKTYIVLLLSGATVLGADTGIRLVTTAQTNAATGRIISTRDVFMRDGQTNLVRDTTIYTSSNHYQVQQFYHDGLLVGNYVTMQNASGFNTEAGSPYSLQLTLGSSNGVKFVVIGTKDGGAVDAFTCTNGGFSPVEKSVVQKRDAFGKELNRVSAEHTRNMSPQDVDRAVAELMKKYSQD